MKLQKQKINQFSQAEENSSSPRKTHLTSGIFPS